MTELLLGVLKEALALTNDIRKDEVKNLELEYLNEINKPRAKRSNAGLDDIELRLCIIARAFINRNGKS